MDKAKIDRINYLARQSRERELTTEEKEEQLELRNEYRASFKRGLMSELDSESEQTFTVYSDDGGYNVIKVSGGAISVSDADCPDKICVKTAPVSDGIQPIVCMPHKLVIRVEARRGEYSYDS